MGPEHPWVIPFAEAADCDAELVGGKAAKLSQLKRAGFAVPTGFCLTVQAYGQFVTETGLTQFVDMELGRRPLDGMRWEEIWDAALRIRSEFLRTEIPEGLSIEICRAFEQYCDDAPLAVRSSAPAEDSQQRSFAGLHESVVGVVGKLALLDAVRLVWASLWSDAALLYRKELSLDPKQSRMAVLVQQMREEDCSGVAFGRDPREPKADRAIVEAVPGRCELLVDGTVDPDRWTLERSSGEILHSQLGDRGQQSQEPLLNREDLRTLLRVLEQVEILFKWPPDMEWTGRRTDLTLLQARPITTSPSESDDERDWYLGLRPGVRRLKELAERVTEERIPQLEADGKRFASGNLDDYDDRQLADTIQDRLDALTKWRKVYWEEFIPLAHGVRQLARYYNDALHPEDPYEFVRLLEGQEMIACRRNRAFAELAEELRENPELKDSLVETLRANAGVGAVPLRKALTQLAKVSGGEQFLQALEELTTEFLDVTYGSERLSERPDLVIHSLIEMAEGPGRQNQEHTTTAGPDVWELERRLFQAVGTSRREEAAEMLRIGRLSWRLRDDDNLLLSRVESQLFRAADLAVDRLRAAGRLKVDATLSEAAVPVIIEAVRDVSNAMVELPAEEKSSTGGRLPSAETTRQLVGQPAAPGLASGKVRCVRITDDMAGFQSGEVLVCDSIQPMVTHLVPLAAAIVERRGGMLIHGAIIARELGIPCVNGIADAVDLFADGEVVTVDGHLGIVTVGPPEFDLELR